MQLSPPITPRSYPILSVRTQPERINGDYSDLYPDKVIYIKSVFGDDYDAILLDIINCESGWKTAVVSRTSDVGLWQINLAAHWDKIIGNTRAEKIEALQDWKYNTRMAYQIYLNARKTYSPWVCYTKKLL